jgi:predicted Rossmann fold nucleotide-binding protein DprA/Smf involved in DNA uptake
MSHQALSADTEVVLLLCGRFGGERQESYQPLSAREYGEFAKWLKGKNCRPADLLADVGMAQLPLLHEAKLERKRVEFLLGRGTALALAVEHWSRGGLWVISRGDPEYPARLKHQLKHLAPPLLYGAGDKALLDAGGLAIIGSRAATAAALEFTRDLAARCARERMTVVSGGARGVDAAAMQGATEAGGNSIGVLASDLLKTSVNRQNRMGLQDGRLVLVSPFYPEARFNAGNAMGRNKYIYALAERALVIDSALGSGGTWEGALEDLKYKWVPLYVRSPGEGPGNVALIDKGGIAFPASLDRDESLLEFFGRTSVPVEPDTADSQQSLLAEGSITETSQVELVTQVSTAATDLPSKPVGHGAEFVAGEPEHDAVQRADIEPEGVPATEVDADDVLDAVVAIEANSLPPAAEPPIAEAALAPPKSWDMYDDFLAKAVRLLAKGDLTEEELATALILEKGQAKAWLKRAAESGDLEKLKKPVRYGIRQQTSLC